MSWETLVVAGALSALAYWLGRGDGARRQREAWAAALWSCGVRSVDLSGNDHVITFRDGTTRTERAP